jgi:hypothetical protein
MASNLSWEVVSVQSPNNLVVLAQSACYSSLVLVLFSVACGTQLALALSRITTCDEGLARLRNLLSEIDVQSGQRRPTLAKMYLWQTPAALLNLSLYMYLVCPSQRALP